MKAQVEKILFKEGDYVAHRDNISMRMEVERVVYKRREYIDENNKPVVKHFCIGVRCRWWLGEELQKNVFHSNTLIPWEIAEKGQIYASRYLESIKK